MGTTASPSTPYCSGFQLAALSVGGQIFITQNPPISYAISGTTITVSDAGGVIGTADLSGNLVLESTQSASPSTNYCGGKPKAVLKWDKGTIETKNTPISYTLSSSVSCNATLGTLLGSISYLGTNSAYTYPSFNFVAGQAYTIIVSGDYSFGPPNIRVDGNYATNNNYATRFVSGSATQNTAGLNLGDPSIPYNPAHVYQKCFISPISGAIGFRCGDSFWLDNSGSISVQFYEGTAITEYTLTVSDSTGIIASYEYNQEPADFVVSCYDYDLKEVSYVCEGNCPGGTEFQCKCVAENKLSCFGYDPADPNWFRPLFVTQLTA